MKLKRSGFETLGIAMGAILFCNLSYASPLTDYYELSAPTIKEIAEPLDDSMIQLFSDLDLSASPSDLNVGSALDPNSWLDTITFDSIVNLGKSAWKIVEEGKPTVDIQTDVANALPEGIKDWQSMQDWQTPTSKVFQITYRNFFGMEAIRFQYRVVYSYGGNLNGKGRYLSQIKIIPSDLRVLWGYKLSVQAKVLNILNAGTTTDPIAAMELLINWTVDTCLRHTQGSSSFFIKGDGTFKDLSDGT